MFIKVSTVLRESNRSTALKTLSLRIRGVKTELEDAGLETEGMAETTAQLQQKLKALTNGKVDIMLNADEFKSTTQILREMADVWQEMTDVQQAAALELLGGKRQANILSSVITNFQTVEDVIQTSMESSGSAIAENEKYLDSIQGRLDLFSNSLQKFWNNLLSSDTIKTAVDAGTGIINLLDTAHGKVIALVAAVKLMAKFKGFSLKGIGTSFIDSIRQITAAQQTLQTLGQTTKIGQGYDLTNIQAYAQAVSNLTAKQQANLLAAQGLNQEQIRYALTLNQVGDEAAREAMAHVHAAAAKDQEAMSGNKLIQQKALEVAASLRTQAAKDGEIRSTELNAAADILEQTTSENLTQKKLVEVMTSAGVSEATQAEIFAKMGLANVNYGLAASIKAIYTANPVGFIMTAVSTVLTLIPIVGDVIDTFTTSSEEIKQAAQEAKDAIASLKSEFQQDAKTVSDYAERFAELAQGVDMLSGKNISLTTDDYEEFLSLSNQLADIFPTLSRNYDENGNAIVQLSGDTDTMVSSLKALLDVQRQITNQKIAENLPDLYKGVKQQSDEYVDTLNDLETRRDTFINQLKEIQSKDFIDNINDGLESGILKIFDKDANIEALNDIRNAYIGVLDEIGLAYQELTPEYKTNRETGLSEVVGYTFQIDYTGMTDEEIEVAKQKITTGINDLASTYSTEINNLNNEIEITTNENKANWSSLLSSIFSWLTTDESYQILSDDMQSVVQSIVNNIDFSKLDNVDTWEKMQKYIQDNIISKIKSATPEVQDAFAQLFKIKANNKTTAEYINAIKDQAKKIANSSDFTYDEVLKNTGFEDIIDKYETSAKNILTVLDDSIPKYYEQYEQGTASHWSAIERYNDEISALKDDIYSLSPDELTRAFDIIKKYGIKTWDDLVKALESKTFDVVLDYDIEKEGIDNFLAAIDESVSATGLSADSIGKLKSRYSELIEEGYNIDALFEETTNGIHLNTQALNELERAYAKQKTDDLNDKLNGLKEHYNKLTEEINNCSGSSKRADLYAQRNNIITQIRDTATLASQYQGLTSAYQQWQNAQSAGNERDMYEGIISGKKELEEEMKRGWIDQGTREYLELLSGKDLSTANYDEILKVYQKLVDTTNDGYNVFDFFTEGDDGSTTEGIFNFFDAVIAKQKELGKEWVKISEDGNYTFDFGVNGDKAIAEALGISEELVQIILRAAKDAGFDINLDTAYSELADLRDMAEEANNKLKEIGATDYTFNIYSTNLEDINHQINKAQEALNAFKSSDGTINVKAEGCEEAQTLLATLIRQRQSLETPTVLEVDTNSASTEVQNAMNLLNDFKDTYNTFEVQVAIGEDYSDTMANLNEILAKLREADLEVLAQLGVNPNGLPEDIMAAINGITPEILVDLIPDSTALAKYETETENGANDIEAKVTWQNVSKEVDDWKSQNHDISPSVRWKNDVTDVKTTFTGQGYIKWNVYGEANGTAHALGTLPPRHSALANGNWGLPRTETALVGELGQELIVDPKNGTWHTVGDTGAEFTTIPKGSIVFNHKQTEQLLKNGYVTGRGKAYAAGSATDFGYNSSLNKELKQYIYLLDQYDKDVQEAITESSKYIASLDDKYKKYGNIDNVDRNIVFWNDEAYDKFYPYIESMAKNAAMDATEYYDEFLRDCWSTVLGTSGTFGFNNQSLDVAYSQMLNTGSDTKLLTADEISNYIFDLMEKSLVDGKIDATKIIAFDAEGLEEEVQGEVITVKNMLAGVEGQIVDGIALTKNDILAMSGDLSEGLDSIYKDFSMHEIQANSLFGKYTEEFGGNSEAFLQLEELSYQYGMTLDEFAEKLYNLKSQMNADPLGINSESANIDTFRSSLTSLGVSFDESIGKWFDGKKEFDINVTDLVSTLQEQGWSSESIRAYCAELSQANIDGVKININSEAIDEVLAKISSIPSDITTTYTMTYQTVGSGRSEGVHIPGSGGRYTKYANGTVHVNGNAYSNGSFGAPKTETALVGELGPELLVRNGRWTTVGEDGAEFAQVKKGDIIFNHKQTEDLLSKGYVTGRGKAFANGTAYSSGAGPGRDTIGSAVIKGSEKGSSSSSANNTKDEFEELFDWIEVRLEEINEQLDYKNAKLENSIGSSKQNAIINEMLDLNKKLYDNLIAGANKYYEYASELLQKVPEEYREAAQDGSIAIEKFVGEADEETLNAIKDYREWVQKGADVTQQAEEVLTEISNLAKQAIDNIANEYENKGSIPGIKLDQLKAYNALLETDLGAESASIYRAMIKANNESIKLLEQQRDKMQAELNEQVEAGNIKKYSQDWYDAINDIAAVDTEIIELTTDTENYQDAINELHWDRFDNLMSRLDAVSDESKNLIDILGSKDLVDPDTGEWTNEGITSLGLYAQQMEVAEMQAKKYKEEINYLNKNWKKLGYTEQEYVEKLEELKEGQYEAIQSYNDTKDAIVDLNNERIDAIKNGIEKEIDAYEELINQKKEALDAEKDLYDFQKSVQEKEKDIAKIEKQLAALAADNSASARAKRAQLEAELAEAQADLQETYYDRSVSDQQDALDKELEAFQEEKNAEIESWDEYLENTELVVSDSLATIQANTDVVYQTLQAMGKEYSLSIAEAITSPWVDGSAAIQDYSEQFGLAMSSTVEELQKLADEYKEVMAEIENAGKEAVNQVNDNIKTYNNENTQQSSNDDKKENLKTIKVGGKINAGSAKIYDYAGDKTGEKQYYSKDPIYKVLAIDGNWVQVRYHKLSKGITGWFKKSDVKAYAKGTKGIDEDQLALIDELGEELVMHAGPNGKLAFLSRGSTVIPHDISENLMQLGKLNPQNMLDGNRPVISAPHITNNNIELNVSFGEVVHIDTVSNDTVPNLAKTVEKQIDKYMKGLNAEIRKYTR